jgi:uncharacterized membrane protein YtjA (UPF0391 family)
MMAPVRPLHRRSIARLHPSAHGDNFAGTASGPQRSLIDGALQCSTLRALAEKDDIMLYWAAVFFVIALVAAVFGFGGIAAGAAEIAKILFFLFLIIFVVAAILGLTRRG